MMFTIDQNKFRERGRVWRNGAMWFMSAVHCMHM
jgi:hypothetical protein